MSDNYYTDRLKGRNNCTISGEVTHSSVTADNPFLLMGSHSGATAFNPSTKLDTIPIRIVDGGAWKYLTDGGSLASYHSGSGYGQLDIEKGFFQAYALRLYGEDAELALKKVVPKAWSIPETRAAIKYMQRNKEKLEQVKKDIIEVEKASLIEQDQDTIMLMYKKLIEKAQKEGKYEVVTRILREIRQMKAIENEQMKFEVIIKVKKPGED